MRSARTPAAAAGFSLVEVMVAVVVICVGLLGIAKIQALSLSNTSIARNRSLAAQEAASFASAMHSNREYWGGFGGAFSVTISGTSGTYTIVSTDANLQADAITDVTNLNACIVTVASAVPACDATHLAAFDLARWWVMSLSPLLPGPAKAIISCPAEIIGSPTPVSCTIQIEWTEKTVALNSQEAAQETGTAYGSSLFEQPIYTLYLEP